MAGTINTDADIIIHGSITSLDLVGAVERMVTVDTSGKLITEALPDFSTFVPNSRQVIAGNGLTGGGALTGNVTLTMGTPSDITLSSANNVTSTSHTHKLTLGGTSTQYLRGDGTLDTFPTVVGSNIYTANGTLLSDRTVYGNSNDLYFTGNPITYFTDELPISTSLISNAFNINFGTSASGNSVAGLKTDNLTAARTFQFPNASGTLALTTDIPTVNDGILSISTGTGLSGSVIFYANQSNTSSVTISIASGYVLPTTTQVTNWTNKQDALAGTGVVKSTAGTISYINGTTSQYIRGDGSLATFPTVTGGTVTSISAGNGMNFTTITASGAVTLGTPSSITLSSTNSVTSTSHTHAFTPGGTTSQYITGAGTLVTFPTIPSVNNGTLTLTTSGIATGSATFTANQSGNSTFTVTVPSTLSSYTNDAGFLTSIPTLQQVTTAGATSTNAITVTNLVTVNALYDKRTRIGLAPGTTLANTIISDWSTDYWNGFSAQLSNSSVGLPSGAAYPLAFKFATRDNGYGSAWLLKNYNSHRAWIGYTGGSTDGATPTWDELAFQGDLTGGTLTSITIGNGLTGTSPITTTGTVTLGTPSNITLSSTNSVTATSHTHAFVPGGTTTQYIRGDGSLATFPTLPTVNDATITIKNGATTLGSFTTNQGTAGNIDISSAIPSTPNLQQVTDVNATTTNPITINYGTVAGYNDILALTQNGGGIGFGNFTSSSGVFTPRMTVTAVGQTAIGLGLLAKGSDTGYSTGALYISARNAAGTGAVTGGNLLTLNNYTTQKFFVDYNGNANFPQSSSVYSNGSQLITHTKQPISLWRNNATTTGYILIGHPMLTGTFQATMFDMTIKLYIYNTGDFATIRLTFYLQSATAISTNSSLQATVTGTNTSLVGILATPGNIQMGFESGGGLRIALGQDSLNWGTYVGVRVEDITTSFTGGNNVQWQSGWIAGASTSVSLLTGLVTVPVTNRSVNNGSAGSSPSLQETSLDLNALPNGNYVTWLSSTGATNVPSGMTLGGTLYRSYAAQGSGYATDLVISGNADDNAWIRRTTNSTTPSSWYQLASRQWVIDQGYTAYLSSTSITVAGNSITRNALSGDVVATANSNSTVISNNAVTNAKAADMAANTMKGRLSSTGDPQDLTVSQVKTLLGIVDEVADNGYGFGGATEGFTGWDTKGGFATGMKVITGNYNLDKSDRSILFYGASTTHVTLLDPGTYPGMELFLSFNLDTTLTTAVVFDGSYQPNFYDGTGGTQTTITTITGTQIKNSYARYMHIQSDGAKWWWLNSSV